MNLSVNYNVKNKIIGTMLVFTAALLWGSSFAVRKIGMSDIGPLIQNAARFFVAFCFMLVIVAVRRVVCKGSVSMYKASLRKQLKYGIIIGTVFGTAALFQQIGLVTASAGTTGFITSIYTVLVPIISTLFFKNRIKKQVWCGIGISLIGLFLVTDGGLDFDKGVIILFMGSIMYALQIVLIGKYIKDADPYFLVPIHVAMGVIVNLIVAMLMHEDFQVSMLIDSGAVILYTGVFSLGIANVCQFLGQKKIAPSITAIACSFEAVFGMVFGIILINESVQITKGIGCMLIFIAIVVSQLERKEEIYEKN